MSTDLRFRHLTTRDVLPTSKIHHVAQDEAGFLWLGTSIGLYRYDGYEVRPYKNTASQPSLLPAGEVLIGTWGQGLYRYAPQQQQFYRYDHVPDTIYSLCQRDDGTVWIGGEGGIVETTIDKQGQLRTVRTVASATHIRTGLASTRLHPLRRHQAGADDYVG